MLEKLSFSEAEPTVNPSLQMRAWYQKARAEWERGLIFAGQRLVCWVGVSRVER